MQRVLRFTLGLYSLAIGASCIFGARAADLQPLGAQAARVAEALDHLGAPLTAEERNELAAAAKSPDVATGVEKIQQILDPHCLLLVNINPESRVKIARGGAPAELVEQGWRTFLVKVANEAGVTAELKAQSPNAGPLPGTRKEQIADRWMDLAPYTAQPMAAPLSGLGIEYRILSIWAREPGQREAKLSFTVGQGTQDLGFRNDLDVLFTVKPAVDVKLGVLDENGKPATASFIVRDALGRIYPSRAKRLAPDLAFESQVYRRDGETLKLPPGGYTIEVGRGPEYLGERRDLTVSEAPAGQRMDVALRRWVDPAKLGWYSGDHHIHAAGCAHYTQPSEGVLAADMIRQTSGEDLKVGCNLTWGPCFDFQKQFFTGAIDKVSVYPYLLRYDIEVSGFGSHQSGHLVLLRLKQEIYPGGTSDLHWPTLCLNTLRWAKKQGAVCGPAHSGWGLEVNTTDLPNYVVPKFSGIGANEYVVDVTHELEGPDGKNIPAVDFMSVVDTPYVWELNMWYQTLNCGYRTRISGETDFPCIYGERVGMGRSYVKLHGPLDFDAWCDGIRAGRCYASDGYSHLIEFRAGDVAVGEGASELRRDKPGPVHLSAKVAALLPETAGAGAAIKNQPYAQKPYWSLERARNGTSREVNVEAIVNGYPVAHQAITADGSMQNVSFDVNVERSSWVALRILPSSHTNPVFVIVGDKPVRASRRSAEWCLKGVDQCWSQKQRFIAPGEMGDAKAAYDHAREAYRKIFSECEAD